MAKGGLDSIQKGLKDVAAGGAAVGKTATALGGGLAKGGVKTTGLTANGVGGLLGGTLSAVGKFAQNHPKITLAVSLYAGIKMLKNFMNKRKQEQMPAQDAWQQAPVAPAALQSPMQQNAGQVFSAQQGLSAQEIETLRLLQQQGQEMHQQQLASPAAGNQWESQMAAGRPQAQGQQQTRG